MQRSGRPPTSKPLAVALRLLAARRLTECQLRECLARKQIPASDIECAVASCRRDGLLDDALYARLYVECKRKAVGDCRLVAELVQRGIEREVAAAAVAHATEGEELRAHAAAQRFLRRHPGRPLPAVARSLERLGFPAPLIYRVLREAAREQLASGALAG